MNIDETNIYFDMESGLPLVNTKSNTMSLKTSGSLMRCSILLGVTLNGEKLTPLVVFKRKSNGRIAKNFAGMPASMRYVCQDKARVDQRVFKYWNMEIWAPFALKEDNPTDLLMDELSINLMSNCCNQSKDCGPDID